MYQPTKGYGKFQPQNFQPGTFQPHSGFNHELLKGDHYGFEKLMVEKSGVEKSSF